MMQRDLLLPGEEFERGAREDLERHHGRGGIAGQPEKELSAGASENQRLSRLDQHAVEIEFGAEFGEDFFHHIVLARRHAAGEQQQVGGEAASDHLARVLDRVARHGQHLGHAAGARHLCGQRPGVGIANLKFLGNLVDFHDFVAGGDNRDDRAAVDRDAGPADRRQQRDVGVIQAFAGVQDHLVRRRLAALRIDELVRFGRAVD